jgi:hypothetical protein
MWIITHSLVLAHIADPKFLELRLSYCCCYTVVQPQMFKSSQMV